MRARLRFFDATVSSTVLYGSDAWAMTTEREQLLKTTFRQMLRKIVGTPRRYTNGVDTSDTQPWVDWIVRAMEIAERQLEKAGVPTWVAAQKKRQAALLGKARTCDDDRWSRRAL